MKRVSYRLGTAVLATALGLTTGAASASAHRPGGPPAAQVWVTTVDRSELLHQRAPVTFGRQASQQPTIVVDPTRTYQRMDGFGASITDSSAAVLSGLAPAVREQTLRSLFDPRQGIGVSFLRQPVGSSDFTAAAQHYTYDDVPAGQTDYALRQFSIRHDRERILPLLREARRLNPRLTVMATPWSPPAWMKTTGSLVGGRLKDDPKIYDAYARYLVRFVTAYAAAGVPIDYLSVQNEPQNRTPSGYPGTDLPVRQEAAVIERLGPLLRAAGQRTRILAYDHNWTTHPGDVAGTPPGESPETDYPYQLLSGPAARWIAGTAYHCYSGDPSAQTALHDAFPDKGIWFTECSGSHGATDPPAKFFRDTLVWHARTIAIGTTRHWAKSVVNWNIALDSTGGPHLGGCDTCTGLVTAQPDGAVTTNAEYYTVGHLSKFVRPGAVRVASTSFGTTGWNGQIMDVAFRNPDGSTALVVHNENDEPRTFAVAAGDRAFEYTLPGGALATFTWPYDPALEPRLRQVPLTGATVTATPAGESPAAAVDDDASTRWSSGQAQEPGQYLQVDLARAASFRRVAIDSGGNLGDYARGWQLTGSLDGVHWHTLATGTGTGQLTTVDLGRTRARYLRVTTTAAAGNWWSVADLRLYA
ncbi:glucosylceramidase [Actinoplanes ianthinogenes]|uniref:Glucosylceramidase n=1 Tax=Actinoplanes ianthinogenes TaxID=122358 RepID=A0ABM7LPA9_9ACTN|nr:discoidin domain-containing protein [Actinoplanes ianthinogenes]BCJ41119.1 glucosylceramidase [Actinoplanes ianthinogenes]GGR22787.1 glucosylceramidase [Actinoplanes ianthinogenes]